MCFRQSWSLDMNQITHWDVFNYGYGGGRRTATPDSLGAGRANDDDETEMVLIVNLQQKIYLSRLNSKQLTKTSPRGTWPTVQPVGPAKPLRRQCARIESARELLAAAARAHRGLFVHVKQLERREIMIWSNALPNIVPRFVTIDPFRTLA